MGLLESLLCVAVMHLDEGLNLETLLTLKKEMSLISLVGTRRQAVSITGQQLFVSMKMLTRN